MRPSAAHTRSGGAAMTSLWLTTKPYGCAAASSALAVAPQRARADATTTISAFRMDISVSPRGRTQGPADDGFHNFGLGVGVVLHVAPDLSGEAPLGFLVEPPLRGVAAAAVAKTEHPGDLARSDREDMQIDVGPLALQQPMLLPVGLAHVQPIALGGEGRHVGRL